MGEVENFVWCTGGCGFGQIHESGNDHPIVTCRHCGHRSCFHHQTAWHEDLTCDEFDRLKKDPEGFKSRLERKRDESEGQTDADIAPEAEDPVARDREAKERERKEMMDLNRRNAAKIKMEEEMSKDTVHRTTKPCPQCHWAIEKNGGW